MIFLRQFVSPTEILTRVGRRNIAVRRLARCARFHRAIGCASSWQGGFYHPPFAIPPVQGRRPVDLAGRAFLPSPPHQTRAFRPWTLTRGLAPATRAGGVPPRPPLNRACRPCTLPHPARMGCAPCREPAS